MTIIHKHSGDSDEPEPDTGILLYLHCKKCLAELPPDTSPRDYCRTQAGVGPEGELIVWCNRHREPVCRLSNRDMADILLGIAGKSCQGPHGGH